MRKTTEISKEYNILSSMYINTLCLFLGIFFSKSQLLESTMKKNTAAVYVCFCDKKVQ